MRTTSRATRRFPFPPLPLAAALLAAVLAAPASADEGVERERFSIAFGGFSPSGPATLGTYVSVNVGQRLSSRVRVGGEVGWYRRDYDSEFRLVSDPESGAGETIPSIASSHIFPFLAAADVFFPVGRGHLEVYGGGGVGFDAMRTKHYPFATIRPFTRSFTGAAWVARGGVSTRPGTGAGAVFTEVFYRHSTIDGEEELAADRPADLSSRSRGVGFRVGFRW